MATSKTVPPASAHSTITATRPTHALNNAPTSATLMTARSWLTFTWFWCTQMTTLTVTTLTVAAAIVATIDRKSTRLNSSHVSSSYAVFCLKKKIKFILAFLPYRNHNQRVMSIVIVSLAQMNVRVGIPRVNLQRMDTMPLDADSRVSDILVF